MPKSLNLNIKHNKMMLSIKTIVVQHKNKITLFHEDFSFFSSGNGNGNGTIHDMHELVKGT